MDNSALPSVVLCDLDGVVWLAHEPIPGSVEAIARLRARGVRVLFVTNNSFSTRFEQETALAAIGVRAAGDVVTSAMSAASVVESSWRVLVCGGAGLVEEVSHVAAEVVVAHEGPSTGGRFDAVVVGMHREFSYSVLSDALTAVSGGARLIGSNADPTYPTPEGLRPGGGSILAAIEKATGVTASVTGKPHGPMAKLVRDMCQPIDPTTMMMVGDRADTDGSFARAIGCGFGLVLSGVTRSSEGIDARVVAADLGALVDTLLE